MNETKKGFWQKVKENIANENEKFARQVELDKDLKKAKRNKRIKLEYLGGHPKINGKEVLITQSLQSNFLIIAGNEVQITKMEWDEKGKRSAGKAAAGAIIGGVLTGGIGLLAGAAIGGRKKDNSLAILTTKEDVIEYTLYFRCDQKEYQQLASML